MYLGHSEVRDRLLREPIICPKMFECICLSPNVVALKNLRTEQSNRDF